MGGVEYVERPFPAAAARLAVVGPQDGQRQQRPPHVGHIAALGQAVEGPIPRENSAKRWCFSRLTTANRGRNAPIAP